MKSFESQLKVYREVTEYSAILDDPITAAVHISRAIEVALKTKRPVYLEIPRDMVNADIKLPSNLELMLQAFFPAATYNSTVPWPVRRTG